VPHDRAVRAVRAAWSEALGVADVEDEDDFFALGGHSLLVVEVVEAVERATGVEIPIALFFERPYVPALAEYVSAGA
jgi:acyl carrier protein